MQPIWEAYVYIFHDNAGAHKCKLVQDFLQTETVVQLRNPPYTPDSVIFSWLFYWKNNLSRRRY